MNFYIQKLPEILLKRLLNIILLAILMNGLACSFIPKTPSVSKIELSKKVTKTKDAIKPTLIFNSDDKVIHCVVKLENVLKNTKVRARWIGVKIDGKKTNEKLVDTDVVIENEENIIDFTLKNESGFAPGEYQVEVFLNPSPVLKKEKPAEALSFKINDVGVTSIPTAKITKVILSLDKETTNSVTTFPTTAEILYCHTFLKGITVGTEITSHWIATKVAKTKPDYEIDHTSITLKSGQDSIYFSLKTDKGLPPGEYRVDLYFNDLSTPSKSVEFKVEDEKK